jgi:hypothetical protein
VIQQPLAGRDDVENARQGESIHLPHVEPTSHSHLILLHSVIAIEAPQPRTKFERRLALKQAATKLSQTQAQEHVAMERLIASKARLQVSTV